MEWVLLPAFHNILMNSQGWVDSDKTIKDQRGVKKERSSSLGENDLKNQLSLS